MVGSVRGSARADRTEDRPETVGPPYGKINAKMVFIYQNHLARFTRHDLANSKRNISDGSSDAMPPAPRGIAGLALLVAGACLLSVALLGRSKPFLMAEIAYPDSVRSPAGGLSRAHRTMLATVGADHKGVFQMLAGCPCSADVSSMIADGNTWGNYAPKCCSTSADKNSVTNVSARAAQTPAARCAAVAAAPAALAGFDAAILLNVCPPHLTPLLTRRFLPRTTPLLSLGCRS